MNQYIGLDVSLQKTFIAVRGDGKRAWRDKCPSDPEIIAQRASRPVWFTPPWALPDYPAFLSGEGKHGNLLNRRAIILPPL